MTLALGVLAAILSIAQEPPRSPLRPATASLDEEFTRIVSVRELQDGRVLVADGTEQRLVVDDFATGSSTQIGRKGKGPGEYTAATTLYQLGADSTLMSDYFGGRWLVLHADRIVQMIPADAAAWKATRGLPNGADTLGNMLAIQEPPARSGAFVRGKSDSNRVILVARASGRADTIARILTRPASGTRQVSPSGEVISFRMSSPRLTTGEEALLFPPPFLSRPLLHAPDGNLVVLRTQSADHPENRYDVVDRNGRLVRGVTLPRNPRLVGFGRRGAYVAETDDEGIQRLRRHPWA